ncbi:MAG: DegT/DnrJ/EryC1/StrS family aminotransferase [Patescibacteria group bacterium]
MRPIHISLGPNYEKDDMILALKTLFNPLKWFDKKEVEKLEQEFGSLFPKHKVLAINSGRSAEYLILKALGIGKGDEVIYQTFTCIAVPNSASWLGAKPVGVETGEDYNIDEKDFVKNISKKTKGVIIQNTFGIPGTLKNSEVQVLEDHAHSLGLKNVGKIAFFSFGRDKVISSVFGGMIATTDDNLFIRLIELRDSLEKPPLWWTLQQLFHPIALSFILPTYSIGIGKLLLVLFQKVNILSRAVYPEEKKGEHPDVFPKRMPGALAILARNQLKKLERFNTHRKEIAEYYFKNLPNTSIKLPPKKPNSIYLRFPIRVSNGKSLLMFARKKGVVLGDWYHDIDSNIVNLPTYPTMTLKDAEKVVKIVKQWLNTQAK